MDKFLDALYSFAEPDRVLLNQPMAQYTTFRIGGPADVMFFPNSTQEILVARALAEESGAPVTVIGCGSNLLVSDDGIAGLVIALLMYIGRLGSLTFALLLTHRRAAPPVRRPPGRLLIG